MKKLNKQVVGKVVIGVVVAVALAGVVAFLLFTAVGKALVFAVTDTSTVLEAREVKTQYVQDFRLGLE